jgi:hypothetical protein
VSVEKRRRTFPKKRNKKVEKTSGLCGKQANNLPRVYLEQEEDDDMLCA